MLYPHPKYAKLWTCFQLRIHFGGAPRYFKRRSIFYRFQKNGEKDGQVCSSYWWDLSVTCIVDTAEYGDKGDANVTISR